VSFDPYLPRLVREWDGGLGPRELDGTLVSVDLSGFTRLSERLQAKGRAGAEELVLAVSGVFEGLIGVAERRGGDVLKFRGDALLLFFSSDGHERRACLAASEMQWLIGETGKMMSSVGSVTLGMSTGVYSGTCHFFLVDGTHRELVVAGPAATATIGLEDAASSGQILVSEGTAAALEPSWLGPRRGNAHLLHHAEESDVAAHLAARSAPTDGDLEGFIPEPLRAHLLLEAGEAEHRHVTAAFVKFSGTDAVILDHGVEEAYARLSTLARIVGEATQRLGLTWLESDIDSGGGKLYLVGGAPSSTGADEDRMLRALQEILAEVSTLELRAGVNRGPAFCGDIGSLTRRTYAVMGDTVNLAARLTARADSGGILATADVLDRARTRFETSPQPFLVKGKEHAITAYSVGAALGEKDEDVQIDLPFSGREQEMSSLSAAVNAARMRQQQLVDIEGEPGIGKSRIVEELKAQSAGFTQLVGHCDPYSSASPYFVFRSLLRPLVGLTPKMDAADAGAQLQPWVNAVMPDLAPMLPLLALVFGAEVPPTAASEEIKPQFRRERLHETVSSFLTRVLLMPTLVVLEDAHWMDDASRELVLHLTRHAEPRPWLICVTRRPQGAPLAQPGVQGHLHLPLAPVGAEAAQSLVQAASSDEPFAGDVISAIVDRAAGNPLYIRELVSASRGARDVASLPDSIETLILARMDTLAPADRFLLRNASVVGASFDLDLLAEVVAQELTDVNDLAAWERLAEFVVWNGPGTIRFIHDLFRAVAYEGLSFRRRREVHARIGTALERRAGEATDEIADLLSLHYHRAEEFDKTWTFAATAGRRAQERSANVEAVELYTRALDAADHIDATTDEVARIAEALGDAAELAARYEQAEEAYARARTLVPDDQITQTHLLRKEGVLRERRGRYPDALRRYGRALKVLATAPESIERTRSQADIELAYSGVKYRQGQFDDAIEWAAKAAASASFGEDRRRVAHAYYLAHIAAVHSGRRDPQHRDDALAILEEVRDFARLTNLQNNCGIESHLDGRWDEAVEWYRRGGESARRVGDVVNEARAKNNEAEVLSDQGRLDEARDLLEDALRVWRAAGYQVGISIATAQLGRVAARAGRFEDAHRLLDEALELFTSLGAEALAAEASTWLAECLVLEGRYKEALAALAGLPEGDPIVERLAGYAIVQSREPFAKAKPHFEASLAAARAGKRPYEVALTLRALAETTKEPPGDSERILNELGVVSTPRVPLP
jgi:class 3 adenylate cyclase/tetratricopeptide (TPR) repeat protein